MDNIVSKVVDGIEYKLNSRAYNWGLLNDTIIEITLEGGLQYKVTLCSLHDKVHRDQETVDEYLERKDLRLDAYIWGRWDSDDVNSGKRSSYLIEKITKISLPVSRCCLWYFHPIYCKCEGKIHD